MRQDETRNGDGAVRSTVMTADGMVSVPISASSLRDIQTCTRVGDQVPATLLMLKSQLAVGAMHAAVDNNNVNESHADIDNSQQRVETIAVPTTSASTAGDGGVVVQSDWKMPTVRKPLFVHLLNGRPTDAAGTIESVDISASTAWPLEVVAAELRIQPDRLLRAWQRRHGPSAVWPYHQICLLRDQIAYNWSDVPDDADRLANSMAAIHALMLPLCLNDLLEE